MHLSGFHLEAEFTEPMRLEIQLRAKRNAVFRRPRAGGLSSKTVRSKLSVYFTLPLSIQFRPTSTPAPSGSHQQPRSPGRTPVARSPVGERARQSATPPSARWRVEERARTHAAPASVAVSPVSTHEAATCHALCSMSSVTPSRVTGHFGVHVFSPATERPLEEEELRGVTVPSAVGDSARGVGEVRLLDRRRPERRQRGGARLSAGGTRYRYA